MLNACSCNNNEFDKIANWQNLAIATSMSREEIYDSHFISMQDCAAIETVVRLMSLLICVAL